MGRNFFWGGVVGRNCELAKALPVNKVAFATIMHT